MLINKMGNEEMKKYSIDQQSKIHEAYSEYNKIDKKIKENYQKFMITYNNFIENLKKYEQ